MNILKKLLALTLLTLTSFLVACGFHLRNPQAIPTQLQTLYLQAESPYSMIAYQVRDLLSSLHVTLVDSDSLATYTLHLDKSKFSHSQGYVGAVTPLNSNTSISSTSTAVSYTYNQSISATLINNETHKTVATRNFTASATQLINQNQTTNVNTTSLATADLPHDLVTQLYLWLTTNELKKKLTSPN